MNESVTPLLRFWQAGGILMPLLAVVSFGIWYLSLRLYFPLLSAARRMRRLAPHCGVARGNGQSPPPASAANGTADGTCPIAPQGNDHTVDHILGFEVRHLRPYERYLNILRALVACSPLLGLLGTVKGMITTFIALGGHGVASMDMLSTGISEALITTQVGLIVAIPGLISSHASARLIAQLKNTLDRLGLHQVMLRNETGRARLRGAST